MRVVATESSNGALPSRRARVAWLLCGLLAACGGTSPLSTEPQEGPVVDAGKPAAPIAHDAGPPKAPAAKLPCGAGSGCDPTDLGGESCESLGLGEGTLLCDPRTCLFEVVLCTGLDAPTSDGARPPCGGGDDCDPADLDGESCATLGLGIGLLACNAETCTFDTSLCFGGSGGSGGTGGGGSGGSP